MLHIYATCYNYLMEDSQYMIFSFLQVGPTWNYIPTLYKLTMYVTTGRAPFWKQSSKNINMSNNRAEVPITELKKAQSTE